MALPEKQPASPPQKPREKPEEKTPKAPEEKRAPALGEAAETRDALKEEVRFAKFGAFVKRVEQSKEHDFFGDDSGVEELRKNEVWKDLQETLRNSLLREKIPPSAPQPILDEWLGKAFGHLSKIIASYDESIGEMKTEDIDPAIEKVFGKSGDPGPFLEWFAKHPDYKTWKEKTEKQKKALKKEKESALKKLAEAKKPIEAPDFIALHAEARRIAAQIEEAVEKPDIQNAVAQIKVLGEIAAVAAEAKKAVDRAEEIAKRFKNVREALLPRTSKAREILAGAKTLTEVESAKRLVETAGEEGEEAWRNLDTVLSKSGIPDAEKQQITARMQNPEFDPRSAVTHLESIHDQRATEALASIAASGNGKLDKFIAGLNKPILGRQIPESMRSGIYIAIITIIGVAASISHGLRRKLISNGTLAHLAQVTGDESWLKIAKTELATEEKLHGAGVAPNIATQMLDLPVSQFLQTPENTFSRDKNQILAIMRVKRSIQKDTRIPQNTGTSVGMTLGAIPDFKIEKGPKAATAAPAERPREATETTAQKLDRFLDNNLTGVTSDERETVKNLSAAKLAKGEIGTPKGFNEDRFQKIEEILKKNKAHEITDSERTVASFLNEKIENNSLLT